MEGAGATTQDREAGGVHRRRGDVAGTRRGRPAHDGVCRYARAGRAELPAIPGRQRVEHTHRRTAGHPDSAAWLASMDAATTNLHPDFAPSGDPSNPYGMPYTVVSPSQPEVPVTFQYADESDPGPTHSARARRSKAASSRPATATPSWSTRATCTLYELWDARYSASGSTAGSGASGISI